MLLLLILKAYNNVKESMWIMRKLAGLLLLCCSLMLSVPAWADQQTTVLTNKTTIGQADVALPYIDGNLDVALEKMANDVINTKARNLLKVFGNKGDLSYTVTLNRPSLVSILLRADYDGKTLYDVANVDLTSGKEFVLNDFFINDEKTKGFFNKDEALLFTDDGVVRRSQKNGPFDRMLGYEELMPSARISEVGRIFQIARLTANADGKILRMKSGNMFALKLDANPSTGFSWILKPTDTNKGKLAKIGSSFVLPAMDDNRVGTPGTEISMYFVKEPGTYEVIMEYKRPWEMFVFKTVRFTLIAE